MTVAAEATGPGLAERGGVRGLRARYMQASSAGGEESPQSSLVVQGQKLDIDGTTNPSTRHAAASQAHHFSLFVSSE